MCSIYRCVLFIDPNANPNPNPNPDWRMPNDAPASAVAFSHDNVSVICAAGPNLYSFEHSSLASKVNLES